MSTDPNTPTPETPPGGEGAGTTTPPALTADAVRDLIAEPMSNLEARLSEMADAAEARQAAGATAAVQGDPDPAVPPAAKSEEELQALMDDPKGWFEGKFMESARANVAPAMAANMESQRDSLISTTIEPEYVSTYGQEFYDEHIKPALVDPKGPLRTMGVVEQANAANIRSVVAGVIGVASDNDESFKAMVEARTAATKEREAMASPGGLGTGTTGSTGAPTLSPEARASLTRLQDAGVPINESTITAAMARGPSLDDYLAAQKSK